MNAARDGADSVVAVSSISIKYTNRSTLANGILPREINKASDISRSVAPKHVVIGRADLQRTIAKNANR
jgi:hypothetical protein